MVHNVYLFQRGRMFYFRWRVPAAVRSHLGRSEIRVSLATDSLQKAKMRCGPFIALVSEIKEVLSALRFREISSERFSTILNRIKTSLASVLPSMLEKGGSSASTPIEPVAGSDEVSGMSFSELYTTFINHKTERGLSERIRKEYQRYYTDFVFLLGDRPLAAITSAQIKGALLSFSDLPRRNLKEYKGKAVSELLEMQIPVEHKLAPKTVGQLRKMLQGMFSFAVHDLSVVSESPANNLKMDLDSAVTFGIFSLLEVATLLNACDQDVTPWKRWLPLLAAYTGARRGELVQLRGVDVKVDSDTGRHYLLISDEAGSVKTNNAVRQVPIHDCLIERGFLSFAAGVKGRLFPSLKPAMVTGWFGRYRELLGILAADDYGNSKVFHSFRHLFITRCRAAGVPIDKIQQVVGHEKVSAGITDRYSHRYSLRDVLVVVDRLSYEREIL